MVIIRHARLSTVRLIGVFAVAALLIVTLARPPSEAKAGTPEEIAALIAASMAAYALAGSPPGEIAQGAAEAAAAAAAYAEAIAAGVAEAGSSVTDTSTSIPEVGGYYGYC